MVLIERSAACSLPLQRKDHLMNHDLKILAGPRLIKRPSLHLYHLCASSLLHWQQYWCPDLSSAIHVS